MGPERPLFDQAELDAIISRLRQEVRATQPEELDGAAAGSAAGRRTRRELDRIWAVTAERPYLYRHGWWGRARGTVLVPPKALLRRLMRWYVEPLAIDQRAFNAGVLRLTDELVASLSSLEERLARLEEAAAEASPPPR